MVFRLEGSRIQFLLLRRIVDGSQGVVTVIKIRDKMSQKECYVATTHKKWDSCDRGILIFSAQHFVPQVRYPSNIFKSSQLLKSLRAHRRPNQQTEKILLSEKREPSIVDNRICLVVAVVDDKSLGVRKM